MINMQQLIDLGLAEDRADLARRTERLVGDMGFGLFQALWVRGRFGTPACELAACGNPPEGFYESSVSVDESARDPVLGRLLSKPGYVSYDHRLYIDGGARDLYDHQAAYGYQHGMAQSMHHSSHAEAFLFGVDGPDRLPGGPVETMRLQGALMLVSTHVQAALQRLVAPLHGQSADKVALTRQEACAVREVAATVYRQHGHLVSVESASALRSAARKLGARTPAGVVLRAIEGGHIQP